jgi:hypothetical protein
MPLILKTFSTISLGPNRTILPPRLLIARAGDTSDRRPIDPRKETCRKSIRFAHEGVLIPALSHARKKMEALRGAFGRRDSGFRGEQ